MKEDTDTWGECESLLVSLALNDRNGEEEGDGEADTVPVPPAEFDMDPKGEGETECKPLLEGEEVTLPLPESDSEERGENEGEFESKGLNEPLAHPDTEEEGEEEWETDPVPDTQAELEMDPVAERVAVWLPLMEGEGDTLALPVSVPELKGDSEGSLDTEGLIDGVRVINDPVARVDAVMEGLPEAEKVVVEHSVPKCGLVVGSSDTEGDSEVEGEPDGEEDTVSPSPREGLGEKQGAALPV
jgi:hypothetical protein